MLGRDQELAVALSALNGGGATSGVVATGAAGVGKSHLVRETVARMRARGAATEWVAATRAAATIPFGAVAHLLAGDARSATDLLQLFRGAGAHLVARAGGARLAIGVDDAHHAAAPLGAHRGVTPLPGGDEARREPSCGSGPATGRVASRRQFFLVHAVALDRLGDERGAGPSAAHRDGARLPPRRPDAGSGVPP